MNVRLIDGNALLEEIQTAQENHAIFTWGELAQVIRYAMNTLPPQPEPVADGDAISRSAVIDIAKRFGYVTIPEMIKAISDLPSIPCAQPEAADVVTAEDVVEGMEWFDGTSSYKIDKVHPWGSVDLDEWVLNIKAVAAMLNVAESIGWPEGHRRNPKPKQPTLLEELLQAYEGLHSAMAVATGGMPLTNPLIRKVKAAIERERKEGSK